MWYWLAEPLLYLSFALASGYILFNMLPASYRPHSFVSYRIAFYASLGIGLFSFFPILRIVSFFAEDIGWGLTFQQVLFQFTEGRVYLFILFASAVMALLAWNHGRKGGKGLLRGMLVCLGLLILAQGWSSHIASWYGSLGIIAQALHVLAISLWVGPLLLAGWQAPKSDQWSRFLGWYHPMAILCMLIIASSGIVLTIGVAPEYVNAWKLTYGQALLIKHLLLIPLVLFAVINGFWVKRQLKKKPDFQPHLWARAESSILIIIFAVTGFMNQQPAPHKVSETLNESAASPLYLWFTNGELDKASDLILSLSSMSIIALIAAIVTFGAAVFSIKHGKAGAAILWSLFGTGIVYYAVMLTAV